MVRHEVMPRILTCSVRYGCDVGVRSLWESGDEPPSPECLPKPAPQDGGSSLESPKSSQRMSPHLARRPARCGRRRSGRSPARP